MTESLRPETIDDVVTVIATARAAGEPVCFRGSGSQLDALPSPTGTPVSMMGLSGVVDHQPDDLTISVRSGTTLAELDQVLEPHGQTAVLPEGHPGRTVGGVVASGDSGYRRLRYGPTSDRVLGVTLVTGYGEVVRGGGPLVKNVTGYDVPRLVTGSHGTLGALATVTLKLWPIPAAAATFDVGDPYAAFAGLYKPLAVVDTEQGASAYVEGSPGVITDAADRLGVDPEPGLRWPTPISSAVVVSVRVPARSLLHATDIVRRHGATQWRAHVGVGELTVGFDAMDEAALAELREEIGALVGIVVVERWSHEAIDDRWGVVPEGVDVQRRLKDLFDPDRVCNPGQLPGDI